MSEAEVRYAAVDGLHLAYQVVGDGAVDLLYVPGWVSHIEYAWEEPSCAPFLERLASFSRLILMDRRGTGLSDPVDELPTLEERMDDVRAVAPALQHGAQHFGGVLQVCVEDRDHVTSHDAQPGRYRELVAED